MERPREEMCIATMHVSEKAQVLRTNKVKRESVSCYLHKNFMKYRECPVCVKLVVKMYLLYISSVEQIIQLTFTFLYHLEEFKNVT
jgi:hypothetical protein